jgi:hypothetical protein
MKEIVRIRRGDQWFLGYGGSFRAASKPRWGNVPKEQAHVCRGRPSANALISLKEFEGAILDIEIAEK